MNEALRSGMDGTADSVLGRIVGRTCLDLARRKKRVPIETLRDNAKPCTRDFRSALAAPGLSLIAEFKPRSPSRGEIRPDADPVRIAGIYGRHASAISVLCDEPHFGGGYATLATVREATDLPLLAKDFIVDPYQIYEARVHGADAVLLMASVLRAPQFDRLLVLTHQLGMEALVEVSSIQELMMVLRRPVRVIGINSRDLHNLEIDNGRVDEFADLVPDTLIRVAESGIQNRNRVDQLRKYFDAVLIGSELMSAPDIEQRIQELGW